MRSRWVWIVALTWVVPACRITPDEIQKIQAENQLLREEIRTVKDRCDYYKVLELEVDEETPGP